jgi:hypothetical protein
MKDFYLNCYDELKKVLLDCFTEFIKLQKERKVCAVSQQPSQTNKQNSDMSS